LGGAYEKFGCVGEGGSIQICSSKVAFQIVFWEKKNKYPGRNYLRIDLLTKGREKEEKAVEPLSQGGKGKIVGD